MTTTAGFKATRMGAPRPPDPIPVLGIDMAPNSVLKDEPTLPPAPLQKPVRTHHCIQAAMGLFGVDRYDLGCKTRHPRVVAARMVITAAARWITTDSFPDIARAIGRPNHSTVITAFRRYESSPDAMLPTVGGDMKATLAVLAVCAGAKKLAGTVETA